MTNKPKKIVFAAGCFWGVQKRFDAIDGVLSTRVGYCGGGYENPDYEKVLSFEKISLFSSVKNHTEAVELLYDDQIVDTESLMIAFWEMHDPTQPNGQGNDIGSNYRSAIFYTEPSQLAVALETRKVYQELLYRAGYSRIVTEIETLKHFYPAEEYHQDYLKKYPQGYCPNHSTGVRFERVRVSDKNMDTATPQKVILLVVGSGENPEIERFNEDIFMSYRGDIPLKPVANRELSNYGIHTEIPSEALLLFVDSGKIIHSLAGDVTPRIFYSTLGKFKLGTESEAYRIAFEQDTEKPFCRIYEQYKNCGDGVFVDKLSGAILFDSKDRFDSGSGWLSFFAASDGATEERADYSHGMVRTEVTATLSGIHLGHLFHDGPGGRRRYCINANVVDFIPREELH